MDTRKLTEALDDLRSKRDVIDDAIRSLESALEALRDQSEVRAQAIKRVMVKRFDRNNIDFAIEILSKEQAMHIEELAKKVSELSGREVSRATLDGGISREIRVRGEKARFERLAPGLYSLRRTTETQLFQ